MTQALGGSYTAMTDHGYLVRVDGTDADAIGEQPTQPMSTEELKGRSVEEVAWDVIPDLAEAMIRSEIERIRKTG